MTVEADMRIAARIVLGAVVLMASAMATVAQPASLEDLTAAVVHVKTHINPDGRTVQNLGLERQGSGIVIGSDGRVLAMGDLMGEAQAAEVVTNDGRTVPAEVAGYEDESGFGLLRAATPLGIKPMGLGRSADLRAKDPVLVASF